MAGSPVHRREIGALYPMIPAGIISWMQVQDPLAAFCDWALVRGYLSIDPLKKFKDFDTTPQETRRAMTREEIQRLLTVAPRHRRLLYEVALLSGLRGNELRQISPDHLDIVECRLH